LRVCPGVEEGIFNRKVAGEGEESLREDEKLSVIFQLFEERQNRIQWGEKTVDGFQKSQRRSAGLSGERAVWGN